MRIAITGAAGFIGSNLARALMNEHEILAIDNFDNGETFSNGKRKYFGTYKNLLDFKGKIICANLLDDEFFQELDDFAPEIIYHFAAISDTTVYDEEIVFKSNINSFYKLIKIAQKHQARLIYASSASVYGDAASPQTVGVDEVPKNPYAFSKLTMDNIVRSSDIDAVGLRYFNVYGGGEYYKDTTASMVLQFGLQILKSNTARLFVGSDQIYRDFVYIDDVTQANILAMSAKSGIYNVGFGVARSFEDIVDILSNEMLNSSLISRPCEKIYIENPYKNKYQFHTQAALNYDFAYRPEYNLNKGIKAYLPEIIKIFKENNA